MPWTLRIAFGDLFGVGDDDGLTDEAVLRIYRDLGDRLGVANALSDFGTVRRLTGDYPGAVRAHEEALGIYRDLGDRLGVANALKELGTVRWLTEDYPAAVRALEEALGIYRDLGDRLGETEVLDETGTLHQVRGEFTQAEKCHQSALNVARAISNSHFEASALAGLARCALATDNRVRAEVLLRQAHEIFQRIGAAEALSVLAELDALSGPGPGE